MCEKHAELLSSVTGGHIRESCGLREEMRDPLQHVVTDEVPVVVIYVLEEVDVKHHQGKLSSVTTDALNLPLRRFLKVLLVVEPCEPITAFSLTDDVLDAKRLGGKKCELLEEEFLPHGKAALRVGVDQY